MCNKIILYTSGLVSCVKLNVDLITDEMVDFRLPDSVTFDCGVLVLGKVGMCLILAHKFLQIDVKQFEY
jgi:hypothetical protein